MRRVLCIWLPHWPVQRVAAGRLGVEGEGSALAGAGRVVWAGAEGGDERRRVWGGQAAGEPVVLEQTWRGVRRVALCSAEAGRWGIRPGMSMAEALAVAGRRRLRVEPYDPVADRQALEKVAEGCQRFSPLVALEEAFAPESLVLDITGLGPLFGGEEALVRQVAEYFASRGFRIRGGVAGTIGAAWAVAHFGHLVQSPWDPRPDDGMSGVPSGFQGRLRNLSSVPEAAVGAGGKWGFERRSKIYCSPHRSEAKLNWCGGMGGSGGEDRAPVPAGQEEGGWWFFRYPDASLPEGTWRMVPLSPAVWEHFPVEALRLPAETVGLLRQLGVRRVGQLERLGRGELAVRFGSKLIERWDQFTGRMGEAICPSPPAWNPRVEQTLDPPSGQRAVIEAVCIELLERLTGMLAATGQGVMELVCQLGCQSGQWVEGSVGLFQPTCSVGHLMELLRLRLEHWRLPGPVAVVRLRAAATAAFDVEQATLFAADSPQRCRRQLAVLIDRLANRLGRRRVLRPRLVADAQPELAYVYDPWVQPTAGRRRRPSGETAAGRMALRPLWLYPRPVPVAVVAVMPDGPPVRFRWQSRHYRVARSWGPERIETGWWRGRPVGRDYYGVETTTGLRFWLFRRLRDGRWFVHGTFE